MAQETVKSTISIKFKAGTVCKVEGSFTSQLKGPLTLECDCVFEGDEVRIIEAHYKNPIDVVVDRSEVGL